MRRTFLDLLMVLATLGVGLLWYGAPVKGQVFGCCAFSSVPELSLDGAAPEAAILIISGVLLVLDRRRKGSGRASREK